MFPLQALEAESGTKTIAQLKQLSDIPTLLEYIETYKAQSKGWFEGEADFEERVKRVQSAARVTSKLKDKIEFSKNVRNWSDNIFENELFGGVELNLDVVCKIQNLTRKSKSHIYKKVQKLLLENCFEENSDDFW